MTFAGQFEGHATVAGDSETLRALPDWAAQRRLKCHWIELAEGTHRSQPMVTWRSAGTRESVLAAARGLCGELQAAGFTPVRLKLECDPANDDVPQTDADPHAGLYFEHHVKLLLVPEAELAPLVGLVRRHAAHLSRNALRRRADGRQERFVTQRCRGVGRTTAVARLADLQDELQQAGFEMIDVEAEYVVYDSCEALDAGWLPEGVAT